MIPVVCYDCRTAFEALKGEDHAVIGSVDVTDEEDNHTPQHLWKAGALQCPGCGTIVLLKMEEKPYISKDDPGFELEFTNWMNSDWFMTEYPTWLGGVRKIWGGLGFLIREWIDDAVKKAMKKTASKKELDHMTLIMARRIRSLFTKIRESNPGANKFLKTMEKYQK